MMDYRGIEALYTILASNSFEIAAKKLCISQSAVSQRLKSVQSYYGDPLILRTAPYSPTSLGTKLVTHFKRVALLEQSLDTLLRNQAAPSKVSIAVNRDGLETWLTKLIIDNDLLNDYKLEIMTCDQEYTIDYLKNGMASICFSSRAENIANCKSELVGYMEYLLVCSPEFKKTYFPSKITKSEIIKAPALLYDKTDELHDKYLAKYFGVTEQRPPYHIIPSVRSFKEIVLKGFSCALIPKLDIVDELENGELCNLLPNKAWKMPFYLHSWEFAEPKFKHFVNLLLKTSREVLDS